SQSGKPLPRAASVVDSDDEGLEGGLEGALEEIMQTETQAQPCREPKVLLQTGCSASSSSRAPAEPTGVPPTGVPPPPQRFTPGPRLDEVRSDCCMARIWGNGFGKQCNRKQGVTDLCGSHEATDLVHGRVDGLVPEAKLREMEKAVLGTSGRGPARSEAPRGPAWTDLSWLSDGEEEGRLQPFRRQGLQSGRRRCFHQRAKLRRGGVGNCEDKETEVQVQVGDFARVSLAGAARRGSTTSTVGEICQMFEENGEKKMLVRQMHTAEELRQQCAASGFTAAGSETIHDRELVETEEVMELPLAALQGPGLEVLSEKEFNAWMEDESVSVAHVGSFGEGGPLFCRRSVAKSGMMWAEDATFWSDKAREARRKACVTGLKGSGPEQELPKTAPLRPIAAGVKGRLELFTRAAAALRPGAAAGVLPCRESEQEEVTNFLKDAVRAGGRKEVLYISGMPGTGKTVSVLEAVRRLQAARTAGSIQSFEFVHINAMCLSSPGAVFAEICRKIPSAAECAGRGRRGGAASESQAQAALARFFSSGVNPGRQVVVLLIDEVDALVTQAQSVLYRLFDWLTRPGARLAVVAIANTMDLPERLLPRVASRLGVLRVNFAPYDRAQLKTILVNRLRSGQAQGAFTDDAIVLCAARVAAASGDARKAFQVCRRALETQAALAAAGEDPGPVTVSQLGAAEADLLRTNPAASAVAGLGLKARRFLLAVVLELRRRPGCSAMPLRSVLRRYEGLMNLCTLREADIASTRAPAVATLTEEAGEDSDDENGRIDIVVPHLRHTDDAHFLLRRLEAMSILAPLARSSAGAKGDPDGEGDEDGSMLELGESLDVDDVADALASINGDDMAKELLGQ
ncbi:unnamed protein product, partial [Polarella glacialis]